MCLEKSRDDSDNDELIDEGDVLESVPFLAFVVVLAGKEGMGWELSERGFLLLRSTNQPTFSCLVL